ncbi:MAG: DUF971 domain-containing protein [Acidobacteria bacterium]|nr:DUF971 domain-containing protein [Acidobacteriota bacterium]
MSYSTDPLHIAVTKSRGVTIDWTDGHRSEFSCALLRDQCPCATCSGSHGTEPQRTDYSTPAPPANPFQMYKPKIRMNSIEEVGAYAFRIDWNDGHSAGIYSFDFLRRLCPCEDCKIARQEGRL